ncbi:unnamed protein product [marine sediment metagenome]|uniref:Lipoprotein n=1 Tax=marine sediment metagenome TaxID=412755 RepID=X0V0V6_9ZZZZ
MRKVAAILVICAFALGGCTAKWPFQWKASENIKQAQALVEDNLGELVPHVAPAGEPHLKEAQGAARAVTTYVGQPKVRLRPIAPINVAAVAEAQADASKPPPSATNIIDAVADEALPLADLAIQLALIFGGVGGAAAIYGYRKKGKAALDAFRDTVAGIENAKEGGLSQETIDKLENELAKAQDKATKKAVTKAKKG